MPAPPAPTQRIVLGVLLLLGGLVLAERSFAYERVACDRAHGVCVIEQRAPVLAGASREVAIADVVDVEFRERSVKGSERGATALVGATGAEVLVAEGKPLPARAHFIALRSFFAGAGERVEVAGPTDPGTAVLGGVAAVGGLWLLVLGLVALRRAPRQDPAARVDLPRAAPPWLGKAAAIAGALALLSVGALVYAHYFQAGLVLRCERRCEFDGGTCPAGGTLELTTSPGERELKIWDPSAPGGWTTRAVTLVAGETTELRCALP